MNEAPAMQVEALSHEIPENVSSEYTWPPVGIATACEVQLPALSVKTNGANTPLPPSETPTATHTEGAVQVTGPMLEMPA